MSRVILPALLLSEIQPLPVVEVMTFFQPNWIIMEIGSGYKKLEELATIEPIVLPLIPREILILLVILKRLLILEVLALPVTITTRIFLQLRSIYLTFQRMYLQKKKIRDFGLKYPVEMQIQVIWIIFLTFLINLIAIKSLTLFYIPVFQVGI